jgi:hypothetical protein
MVSGDGGKEDCCNEGRESIGRGTGVSRTIFGWEVESASVELMEEANEVPRGGTTKGEVNGCRDIWV